MTHNKLILMAGLMALVLPIRAEAQVTKNVNVVNEPNVNILNNVDATITNDASNPVPVVVQGGTNNGQEKELVEIVRLAVLPQTTLDVFTVPPGKRLVITDVLINNISAQAFSLAILRDGNIASFIRLVDQFVPHNHSYVSGIEFLENQVVSIQGSTLGSGSTDWELRGYLTSA